MAGDIILSNVKVFNRSFAKFTLGFVALISLGVVGALVAGLYEVNQDETALIIYAIEDYE